MPLPALDALAVSATGDIDAMRPPGAVRRTMRPPHELARELGHLLRLLLSSGRPELARVPAACLDAVRRVTMRAPIPGGLRPIASPHALFTALEAFRPRDTPAALAALFARWVSTSPRAPPPESTRASRSESRSPPMSNCACTSTPRPQRKRSRLCRHAPAARNRPPRAVGCRLSWPCRGRPRHQAGLAPEQAVGRRSRYAAGA